MALALALTGCDFFDWEPDALVEGAGRDGAVAGECPTGYPTAATGRFEALAGGADLGTWTASVRPIGDTQLEVFACVLVPGGERARIGTVWNFAGPVVDQTVSLRVPSSVAPGMAGLLNDLEEDQSYEFLTDGSGQIEVTRFEPHDGLRAAGSIETGSGSIDLDVDLTW